MVLAGNRRDTIVDQREVDAHVNDLLLAFQKAREDRAVEFPWLVQQEEDDNAANLVRDNQKGEDDNVADQQEEAPQLREGVETMQREPKRPA